MDTQLVCKIRDFIGDVENCHESDVRHAFGGLQEFEATWEWMTAGDFVVNVGADGLCKKGIQWDFDKVSPEDETINKENS